MNRLLLIGHSHQFEARAHALLGAGIDLMARRSQPFGPLAVLGRLGAADRPDVALIGPLLSDQRAFELSAGLARLFPEVGIVMARAVAAIGGATGASPHKLPWPGTGRSKLFAPVRRPDARLEATMERSIHSPAETAPGIGADTAPQGAPRLELVPELAPEVDPDLNGDLESGTESDSEPDSDSGAAEVAVATGTVGQVIAVVSAKGGVGKTTIATNLAVGLARDAPLGVVLVDADVQFGDVATALSLVPSHTLPDVVTGVVPTDTMVLKTYLTPHPSGFYVVCGAETPDEGDRVSGDQLSILIRQLAEVFAYVIVDTAPGLGDHALAALELATDAVMVCDMSVPSIRGLRKELAILAGIGIMPASRHIVLNLGDRAGGMSVRDVEATIGVPVDIAIRRSNLIAISTNRGLPLLTEGSRDPATRALNALVHRFDPTASLKSGRRHRRVVVA